MEEKFNIVKRGYDIDEVNKYIYELETVLSSYKEKDTAIKNAIINAQIAADCIIANAEKEAAGIKAQTLSFLDGTLDAVLAYKRNIGSFKDDYNAMIDRYSGRFDETEAHRLISNANEIESYISEIKASIIDNSDAE